jgi:hypothetical protein
MMTDYSSLMIQPNFMAQIKISEWYYSNIYESIILPADPGREKHIVPEYVGEVAFTVVILLLTKFPPRMVKSRENGKKDAACLANIRIYTIK